MVVRGSSFISDMVNDLNTVAKEGLDEAANKSTIEALFQQLVDQTIIGDIVEAWHLFDWLKIEKKVFNNIEWKKAYKGTSIAGLTDIFTWINYRFTGRPTILEGPTEYGGTIDVGLHIFNGTCSYLELPLDWNITNGGMDVYVLDVDEAIDLAAPYLPSYLEIYATYVATGKYELADAIYDYYVDNYKPEITVYQLTTITEEVKDNARESTKYTVKVDDGPEEEITESEYNRRVKEAEEGRGFFKWLKDKIVNFANDIKAMVDAVIETIKRILGAYITVDSDYVGVVTKGYAFDYKIDQTYDIGLVKYEAVRKEPAKAEDWDQITYTGEEKVTKEVCETTCYPIVGCKENCEDVEETIEHEYVIKAYSMVECDVNVYTYAGQLEYVSSSIEEFDEGSRYQYVLKKVLDADPNLKYTEDEVGIAIDVMKAYCSEKYGLLGGTGSATFVAAGPLNESIVNFATQFENKNLHQMMAIDDTGTFYSSEWCAMFVTYCMKKAQVPGIDFVGCTTFWTLNKGKPGFYDISSSAGAKNGGYITSDRNHIATYKEIQPGDVVLFRWNNARTGRSHTGIVVSVDKNNAGDVTAIKVVEGNTGSGGYSRTKVSINTYTPGGSMYNIVSFVSVSEVMAEHKKGNSW